jgi:glyoxylase-like metal-dependent hydrolase (beta-lactamase superfamily II)
MTLQIVQIPLSTMATFAYLVGDPVSRTALVVDPAADTGKILIAARGRDWTIIRIVNTHGHADHTAGNAAMIAATGAPLLIHRLDAERMRNLASRALCRVLGGKVSPPADRLLDEGDRLILGSETLTVLHTPGHTPGGICLYTPGHVITGDTLFVSGVGRTDLPGGSTGTLMKSIRKKIFTLPDDTVIWPGHDYGPTPHSTVAREKTVHGLG